MSSLLSSLLSSLVEVMFSKRMPPCDVPGALPDDRAQHSLLCAMRIFDGVPRVSPTVMVPRALPTVMVPRASPTVMVPCASPTVMVPPASPVVMVPPASPVVMVPPASPVRMLPRALFDAGQLRFGFRLVWIARSFVNSNVFVNKKQNNAVDPAQAQFVN